jgi:methylase of polypeptide subunit release factors
MQPVLPAHLTMFGRIFLEIGAEQGAAVADLLSMNFKEIEIIKDYAGLDRIVAAKLIYRQHIYIDKIFIICGEKC